MERTYLKVMRLLVPGLGCCRGSCILLGGCCTHDGNSGVKRRLKRSKVEVVLEDDQNSDAHVESLSLTMMRMRRQRWREQARQSGASELSRTLRIAVGFGRLHPLSPQAKQQALCALPLIDSSPSAAHSFPS